MTDSVVGDQVTEDWVGCLVLTVAPGQYMAQVTEAVLQVERTIFGDPVLVDMARAATPSMPDPLGGDLDDVALGLHRDLVAWARSPARNPAPRFTFCVLLVHPDIEEAGWLARSLAATTVLSELPIIFRIGGLTPAPTSADGDAQSEAEQRAAVARMILDAITATAHEVDRTPSFCLTTGQLAARRRARPAPADQPGVPEIGPTRPPATTGTARHAAPSPSDAVDMARPAPDYSVRPNPAVVDYRADAPAAVIGGHVPQPDARPADERRRSVGRAILGRIRFRRPRRTPPTSGVEVINELSKRADRVSMLYLVFVSAPVRPSRRHRRLRAEVATTLARSLLTSPRAGRGPWYVRAFTADRALRPGSPLPGPELLGHKDFPDRWGEHLDLYDIVDDITDSIDRDTSSFVRRGLELSRTVVVFLGNPPPGVGDDAAQRLVHLCTVAETIWVSFDHDTPVPERLTSVGALVLRHHEDAGDELLRLVSGSQAAEPTPPPPADVPTEAPADPSETDVTRR